MTAPSLTTPTRKSQSEPPRFLLFLSKGGMWGIRGGVITDMAERIDAWGMRSKKLDDMHFLAAAIWPDIQSHILVHSSIASRAGGVPFPPHSPWEGHVGQQVMRLALHAEDSTGTTF